jgi:hypothetical protein
MAKPNYSYEKRQRELARKKKQEEKRQRKAAHRTDDRPADATPADGGETPPAAEGAGSSGTT